MTFTDLKIGDKVVRIMGSNGPPMEMVVKDIKDGILYCYAAGSVSENWPLDQLWRFDAEQGCEEDEGLGWGKAFGVTGTYLKKKEDRP
jgi:hypothetical protein